MSSEPNASQPHLEGDPIAFDATQAATAPSPAVREEIEEFLDRDQSALGDVWRRTKAGESRHDIQAARGTQQSSFVWSYLRVAKALVDGDLPTAPSVALQVA